MHVPYDTALSHNESRAPFEVPSPSSPFFAQMNQCEQLETIKLTTDLAVWDGIFYAYEVASPYQKDSQATKQEISRVDGSRVVIHHECKVAVEAKDENGG